MISDYQQSAFSELRRLWNVSALLELHIGHACF